MDSRRHAYLEAMGITAWARRHMPSEPVAGPEPAVAPAPCPSPAAEPDKPSPPVLTDAAALGWEGLEAAVSACARCAELAGHRTRTVFGTGNREATLMVVGEAPGADEDRLGEPFVGRAGKLLDAMLAAIGHGRSGNTYIANVLKCRPPRNRDPLPEEAAACEPYLQRQIALVRPQALLVVGRIAAQQLLQSDAPIGRLRGRVHRYGESDLPLVVTYHPAYLLRTPSDKRKAWDDLRLLLSASRGGA